MTNNNQYFFEYNLSGRLKKLSAKLFSDSKKIFSEVFKDINQRSFNLLSLISRNGPQSVRQISQSLNVTHPATVQIVNKLIKKKLVEKYDLLEDRRITMIKITNKGNEAFNILKLAADKIDDSYKELINEVDPKFLVTLSTIEEKLNDKSIYDRFNERLKNEQIKNVKIVSYNPKYRKNFKDLNIEWLNKYFEIETEDKIALENPEDYYIKTGGEIFFALIDESICGTCALKRITTDSFEISKMAVKEDQQGKQIGKKLALTAIGYAYEKGVQKIILETSPKLTAAISLYKKLGFNILPDVYPTNFKRTLFKMELKLK